MLQEDGTCKSCDEILLTNPESPECKISVCTINQVALANGDCEDCPEYTRALTHLECKPDRCSLREKLIKTGECEHCPDYYAKDPLDNKKCSQPTCEPD